MMSVMILIMLAVFFVAAVSLFVAGGLGNDGTIVLLLTLANYYCAIVMLLTSANYVILLTFFVIDFFIERM